MTPFCCALVPVFRARAVLSARGRAASGVVLTGSFYNLDRRNKTESCARFDFADHVLCRCFEHFISADEFVPECEFAFSRSVSQPRIDAVIVFSLSKPGCRC